MRILLEWATLEEASSGAIGPALGACGDRAIEHDALRGLPRLHGAGDTAGAASDRNAAISCPGEDRPSREVELAELITRLGRHRDALGTAERALKLSQGNARAIACSSSWSSTRTRARATVLAEQYATGGEARHEAQALGVMLGKSRSRRATRSDRLADVRELGACSTALDVMLRAASTTS
jgi:hypothetical protein